MLQGHAPSGSPSPNLEAFARPRWTNQGVPLPSLLPRFGGSRCCPAGQGRTQVEHSCQPGIWRLAHWKQKRLQLPSSTRASWCAQRCPCELVEQGIWKTHLPILPRQSHERRSFNWITLPLLGGSISRFVPMLVKQAAQRGFHIVLVSPQHAVVVDWWFLFCQSTFQTCPGKLRMPDQGNGCYNSTALKQR